MTYEIEVQGDGGVEIVEKKKKDVAFKVSNQKEQSEDDASDGENFSSLISREVRRFMKKNIKSKLARRDEEESTKKSVKCPWSSLLTYRHDAVLPMELSTRSLRIAIQHGLTSGEYNEGMILELEDLEALFMLHLPLAWKSAFTKLKTVKSNPFSSSFTIYCRSTLLMSGDSTKEPSPAKAASMAGNQEGQPIPTESVPSMAGVKSSLRLAAPEPAPCCTRACALLSPRPAAPEPVPCCTRACTLLHYTLPPAADTLLLACTELALCPSLHSAAPGLTSCTSFALHQLLRSAPDPLRPALALSPLRRCAPAAPSLHPDHTQIPLLCAPCCVDPAAAPLSLQPTNHETNLQDDITLQISWLFCRASFGLIRSTVEGKRRKIEGFG
ncbi:hypothetical protein SLEP1_g24720 [Rubroshorea leprosula]|uniref:Uncharacterized protein n=1 Tax=Rubroshorea leprosula TaxID=152421 RepID=A0AAV5JS26_9ROSI|nr:hypothetical protein SLEP1_g24720 [Rubroshorea leprosula]